MSIAIFGLSCCLLFVFFQDLKYRKIHILLPIAIFLLAYFSVDLPDKMQLVTILYNLLFFVITLIFLILYMTIKNKKFLNPFQNYFGLGDFLFYCAITPLFFIQNFIFFFIASMVFAITVQLTFKNWIKATTIPLAGLTALLLLMVIVKDTIIEVYKITLL